VLRSDRLDRRRLEASDAEFVTSLYADVQVTRTLLRIQRPISIEEAYEFCRGLWHWLLRRSASESERLCHGNGGHVACPHPLDAVYNHFFLGRHLLPVEHF
jgi:hypothetical protein